MKVTFVKKNLSLRKKQEEYITKKIEHLAKLSKRVNDDSSHSEVEIEKLNNKTVTNISMKVNLKVPAKLLRAEVVAGKVEEAIDICEEKLKSQINKYKDKFGKNDMHKKTKGELIDESTGFDDLIN